MASTLPEKLLHEISSMPIICVVIVTVTNSFICYVVKASIKIYLTIWPANMNSIVFSITDFEITEEKNNESCQKNVIIMIIISYKVSVYYINSLKSLFVTFHSKYIYLILLTKKLIIT